MRILFTCGREPQYVRNEVILRALRKRYQVTEITDRGAGSLIARNLRLLPRLLSAVRRNDYDLIFVGFYGYLLVPWLRRLTKRPLVFDAFVSNFDTLCFDRKKFSPDSLMGKLAFQLDRLTCRSADLVLLDTAAQQRYFADTFDLPLSQLNHLYVSCNEAMFYPRPQEKSDDQFTVLSYSSYLPLHGIEDIVKAARILTGHPDIRFRLIGRGQTYPAVHQLAEQLQANNIDFAPSVAYYQLPLEIAQADVCLAGPFGTTGKAGRVIPGKLFQFLAMARPAIAGDAPANRELLTNRRDALLVPPGQPEALAGAILAIKQDDRLRETLATQGYRRYQTQASEEIVGQKLYQLIDIAAKAGESRK